MTVLNNLRLGRLLVLKGLSKSGGEPVSGPAIREYMEQEGFTPMAAPAFSKFMARFVEDRLVEEVPSYGPTKLWRLTSEGAHVVRTALEVLR